MSIEQRQREAGLPPIARRRPRRHDLDRPVSPLSEDESEVSARAEASARRSRERRARRTRSASRARVTVAVGGLLAIAGLAGAMWLTADAGAVQAGPEPAPVRDGGIIPSHRGIEAPAAPTPFRAPADRAPEARSGAS